MIEGVSDQKGHIYSKIKEGGEEFIVTMRPKALINYSLHYYCSSLKGALDGTRSILGSISMLPIMISPDLDLFWFPCSSPSNPDCIWLSLSHVQKAEKINSRQTKVGLSFDHSIIIDMKKARFDKKHQRATQLRYINSERSKRTANFLINSEKEDYIGL